MIGRTEAGTPRDGPGAFALVLMIGGRLADLIEAGGTSAAPKGRMDGSSQDHNHALDANKNPCNAGRVHGWTMVKGALKGLPKS